MTEEERIELLREVARVAPKEMGAEFKHDHDDVPYVHFQSSPCLLTLDGWFGDGNACGLMLDAMEQAGYICVLTRECEETTEPGWQRETVRESGLVAVETMEVRARRIPKNYACQVVSSGKPSKEIAYGYGSTRAEAIARAFVAVFQTHESPAREGGGYVYGIAPCR